MRTFFEFRKMLDAEVSKRSHPEKYPAQNFHASQNFVESKIELQEDSWLSKGFVLGQGVRHASVKSQIDSLTNHVVAACDRGRHEADLDRKFDDLFDAISKIAACLKLHAELSRNTINVGIASNLLEDDIKTQVRAALGLKR